MKEDIGETTNRAGSNAEKVNELDRLLTTYLKEVYAQLPIHKSTGETVAYPK